ncbi:MAG: hypothetical protein J0L92_19090 [Deltaproteobacteria bacterium]|nr:hypothetical protein [Deltaproteobacteria bacterium]
MAAKKKLKKKRVLTEAGISLETLEQTPGRVATFLMGLVKERGARAMLQRMGYDKAEHQRGTALFIAVAESRAEDILTPANVLDAITELDNWDEPHIRALRAILKRFPDVFKAVLFGIEPIAGPEAVFNVERILQRMTAAEKLPGAKEAFAVLAKRGYTPAERKRLAALVKLASDGDHVPDTQESEEAYVQALLALREWYDEWSEIARLTIKRRDYLITLGLAERRGSGGGGGGGLDIIDPTPFLDPNKPSDPSDPESGT